MRSETDSIWCSIFNRRKHKHVVQTSIYSRMLDYIMRTPNPSKNVNTLHSYLFYSKEEIEKWTKYKGRHTNPNRRFTSPIYGGLSNAVVISALAGLVYQLWCLISSFRIRFLQLVRGVLQTWFSRFLLRLSGRR